MFHDKQTCIAEVQSSVQQMFWQKISRGSLLFFLYSVEKIENSWFSHAELKENRGEKKRNKRSQRLSRDKQNLFGNFSSQADTTKLVRTDEQMAGWTIAANNLSPILSDRAQIGETETPRPPHHPFDSLYGAKYLLGNSFCSKLKGVRTIMHFNVHWIIPFSVRQRKRVDLHLICYHAPYRYFCYLTFAALR